MSPSKRVAQVVLDRQEVQEESAGKKARQHTSLVREHAKDVVQEVEAGRK